MLRLIRNGAGLYLKPDGTWTEDFAEAKHFPNAIFAMNAKRQFQLKKVELVLIMNAAPSRFGVVVPMWEEALEH